MRKGIFYILGREVVRGEIRRGAGTLCPGVGGVRKWRGYPAGFAIPVAMCMIAVVAVAMTAVCALLGADVRRTLNGAADSQLRQMLIAGEVDALGHLSDPTQREWTTAVPESLGEGRVTSRRLDGAGKVRVTAVIDGRMMSEVLRFEQGGNGWRLAGAELEPGCARP